MIRKCQSCGKTQTADASVRAWYCTPSGSKKTETRWLCLTDAVALERLGWKVVIAPTTAQRKTARAWGRAGIGSN